MSNLMMTLIINENSYNQDSSHLYLTFRWCKSPQFSNSVPVAFITTIIIIIIIRVKFVIIIWVVCIVKTIIVTGSKIVICICICVSIIIIIKRSFLSILGDVVIIIPGSSTL